MTAALASIATFVATAVAFVAGHRKQIADLVAAVEALAAEVKVLKAAK
jgi:uncharacterized membrane protein